MLSYSLGERNILNPAHDVYWRDSQKVHHEMQNMNLKYLMNARRMIATLVEGNSCVCPSKTKIEAKVKEFDLAINLLLSELQKSNPPIPENLREKSTLYNFGYRNTWDIK